MFIAQLSSVTATGMTNALRLLAADAVEAAQSGQPTMPQRLCGGFAPKPNNPSHQNWKEMLGIKSLAVKTGAVSAYHAMVQTAVGALEGSVIPVAAVSTGFPAGLTPHPLKVMEIEHSVASGAR